MVRNLIDSGFESDDVRRLFRLIDWLLELPSALEPLFYQEVHVLEEEKPMPFVTLPERMGMYLLLEDALRLKFGDAGVSLMPAIRDFRDGDVLRGIHRAILTTDQLDDVRRAVEAGSQPPPKPTRGKRRKAKDSE